MKPINIRITPAIDSKIREATEKTGIPQADVMRMAIALGLKDLEMIGYDIDGAIFDRVQKSKEVQSQHLASLPDIPTKLTKHR